MLFFRVPHPVPASPVTRPREDSFPIISAKDYHKPSEIFLFCFGRSLIANPILLPFLALQHLCAGCRFRQSRAAAWGLGYPKSCHLLTGFISSITSDNGCALSLGSSYRILPRRPPQIPQGAFMLLKYSRYRFL